MFFVGRDILLLFLFLVINFGFWIVCRFGKVGKVGIFFIIIWLGRVYFFLLVRVIKVFFFNFLRMLLFFILVLFFFYIIVFGMMFSLFVI